MERPGGPKSIVRVFWECLAEEVREVLNFHLWESFEEIMREAGDIESKWMLFLISKLWP